MSNILDRIDATLDGLCPCGANPRPGSAYCSTDCEPTHHGRDTIAHRDGTAMRWRPDLVTAHDDFGLRRIDWSGRNGYTGPYNAAVYERAPGIWHLRLDDSHRYVGLDIAADTVEDSELLDPLVVGRIHAAWPRLERELTDRRRLEPDATTDPWAGLWSDVLSNDGFADNSSSHRITVTTDNSRSNPAADFEAFRWIYRHYYASPHIEPQHFRITGLSA